MPTIKYRDAGAVLEAVYAIPKAISDAAGAGEQGMVEVHRLITGSLATLGAAVTSSDLDGAALAAMPPHRLVVFYASAQGRMLVAALPEEAIDEVMRAALDTAHGKHYVLGDDVSDAEWLAFARLQLALGVVDGEQLDTEQTEFRTHELLAPEVAAAHSGQWLKYAAEPVSLNRRFVRFHSMTAGD